MEQWSQTPAILLSMDSPSRKPSVSRSPRRLTVTIPYALYERLVAESDHQGRSLSNYAAFLLESSLDPMPPAALPLPAWKAKVPALKEKAER